MARRRQSPKPATDRDHATPALPEDQDAHRAAVQKAISAPDLLRNLEADYLSKLIPGADRETERVALRRQLEDQAGEWRESFDLMSQIAGVMTSANDVYEVLSDAQRARVCHPSQVEWWLRRYCAPVLHVVQEDITGKRRPVGVLRGRGIGTTTQRRRRRWADVARAVDAYYKHAAGESFHQIAGKLPGQADDLRKAVTWLKAQLKSVPAVALGVKDVKQ